MKLLLDESLPRRLSVFFPPQFDVFTTQIMGWSGISNGEPLRRAAAHSFDALLTVDCGIQHQQNLSTIPIAVIILLSVTNRIDDLRPLIPSYRLPWNFSVPTPVPEFIAFSSNPLFAPSTPFTDQKSEVIPNPIHAPAA